jgi:hypothetical protein
VLARGMAACRALQSMVLDVPMDDQSWLVVLPNLALLTALTRLQLTYSGIYGAEACFLAEALRGLGRLRALQLKVYGLGVPTYLHTLVECLLPGISKLHSLKIIYMSAQVRDGVEMQGALQAAMRVQRLTMLDLSSMPMKVYEHAWLESTGLVAQLQSAGCCVKLPRVCAPQAAAIVLVTTADHCAFGAVHRMIDTRGCSVKCNALYSQSRSSLEMACRHVRCVCILRAATTSSDPTSLQQVQQQDTERTSPHAHFHGKSRILSTIAASTVRICD